MSWWEVIWLIGSALIGVWTLLEIRKEPPASKVLVLFIGAALMILWPVALVCVVAIAIWTLVRDLWSGGT